MRVKVVSHPLDMLVSRDETFVCVCVCVMGPKRRLGVETESSGRITAHRDKTEL